MTSGLGLAPRPRRHAARAAVRRRAALGVPSGCSCGSSRPRRRSARSRPSSSATCRSSPSTWRSASSGASFVACGLVAWRRRPDNRSGLLMTATGFALFASPLLAQVDAPLAQTLGLLLPDLWVLFFVPLVLTLLTGGRLRTLDGPRAGRRRPAGPARARPAVADVRPGGRQPAADRRRPARRGRSSTRVQLMLFVAVPVGTALVLGGAVVAPPRRRVGGRSCPGWRARLACCSSR